MARTVERGVLEALEAFSGLTGGERAEPRRDALRDKFEAEAPERAGGGAV